MTHLTLQSLVNPDAAKDDATFHHFTVVAGNPRLSQSKSWRSAKPHVPVVFNQVQICLNSQPLRLLLGTGAPMASTMASKSGSWTAAGFHVESEVFCASGPIGLCSNPTASEVIPS